MPPLARRHSAVRRKAPPGRRVAHTAWTLVVFAASTCLAPNSLPGQDPAASAADREPEVAVSVVAPDGRVRARIVGRGTDLVDTVRTTARSGETVKQLVGARGVVPDAGALAWVYTFNPTLSHADTLAAGTSLLLPRVTDRLREDAGAAPGDRFVLEMEPKLREEVSAEIALFRNLQEDTRAQLGRRDDATEAVLSTLDTVAVILERTELDGAAASAPVLAVLRSRAADARNLAFDVYREKSATPEMASVASELAADVADVRQVVASAANPMIEIVVRSIRMPGRADVLDVELHLLGANEARRPPCDAEPRMGPCRPSFADPDPPLFRARVRRSGGYVAWATRDGRRVSCDTPVVPLESPTGSVVVRIPFDPVECGLQPSRQRLPAGGRRSR